MRAVGTGLHNSFLKQIICNFLVESCNEVLILVPTVGVRCLPLSTYHEDYPSMFQAR